MTNVSVQSVAKHFGPVDVLINNAGAFAMAPFVKTSAATFDDMIATNLRSAFLVTSAFLPAMLKRKRGDIFFMSYSGHGGQLPDFNGDEDDDGLGRDLGSRLFDLGLTADKAVGLARMQANVGFVEDEESVHQSRAETGGEVDAFGFATAQRACRAIKCEIAEADFVEVGEAGADLTQGVEYWRLPIGDCRFLVGKFVNQRERVADGRA